MKASLNESEVIGSQSSKEQKIWPVKKHLPCYSDTLHCRNIYLQQGKFSQSSQLKKKKILKQAAWHLFDQNLSAGN